MNPSSPAQTRILIIDDDEDDFLLTRQFIEDFPDHNFQIDWCGTYLEASQAIHAATHDIYFVDYNLGARTGIELIRYAIQQACKNPLILLTGQGNPKIDKEAMRSGAADYLVKSELTPEKLDRCIRYALERAANLKESLTNERRFRTLFEHSRDAIFLSNENLEVRDFNSAALDLFGYPEEELLQMTIYQLMAHSLEKDALFDRLQNHLEIVDFQCEFLIKYKPRKTCLVSVSFELDAAGNGYVQAIIQDKSMFRKMEEIKLQSEKLEAKGLVIRTLAHEIRNPLHNITLSLGYLKTQLTEENQEFLNVIDRNSERINDLINKLMDSNQFHRLKLEVTPLQAIVQETLETAADQIALSKIKLKTNYPSKAANALVDREKIKIAFLNIIVNAIEAMAAVEGELTITLTSVDDFHQISIADNGCGMSEEDTHKLFEPYFTSKPAGVGLGLASTYAILQSHKAEIKVESTLAVGTTILISFPAL